MSSSNHISDTFERRRTAQEYIFTTNKKERTLHEYHKALARRQEYAISLNHPSTGVSKPKHVVPDGEIAEIEYIRACKSDDLDKYKKLVDDKKAIYINSACVYAAFSNKSSKFIHYFLEHGFNVFMDNCKYLRYLIQHSSVEVMDILVNYQRANSKLYIEHRDELLEYAILSLDTTMVNYFLELGMTTDFHEVLVKFNNNVTIAARHAIKPGREATQRPGLYVDGCHTFQTDYNSVLDKIHEDSIFSLKPLEQVFVFAKPASIFNMHVLLLELTTRSKEQSKYIIPKIMYKNLTPEIIESYAKLNIYPTDFTAMWKFCGNFDCYRLVIPHTIIVKDLELKSYTDFIRFITVKLNYLECLRVRPDCAHVLHDCWNMFGIHATTDLNMINLYYEYLGNNVIENLRFTEKIVKWMISKGIPLKLWYNHHAYSEMYSVVKEYDCLDLVMTSTIIFIENKIQTKTWLHSPTISLITDDHFDLNTKCGKFRHKLYNDLLQQCIAANDYASLEHYAQYIPGGLTRENVKLIDLDNVTEKLLEFIDNTSVCTKSARKK
tara:strand:+ start:18742 stop:20391 length:1650 start_codon:yes stop_codon:yes gene_type:complete